MGAPSGQVGAGRRALCRRAARCRQRRDLPAPGSAARTVMKPQGSQWGQRHWMGARDLWRCSQVVGFLWEGMRDGSMANGCSGVKGEGIKGEAGIGHR